MSRFNKDWKRIFSKIPLAIGKSFHEFLTGDFWIFFGSQSTFDTSPFDNMTNHQTSCCVTAKVRKATEGAIHQLAMCFDQKPDKTIPQNNMNMDGSYSSIFKNSKKTPG